MTRRTFHVHTNISTQSDLIAGHYIGEVDYNIIILFPVHRHRHYFPLSVFTNNALMSILVYRSLLSCQIIFIELELGGTFESEMCVSKLAFGKVLPIYALNKQ